MRLRTFVPIAVIALLVTALPLPSAGAATPARFAGVSIPNVPGDMSGLTTLTSELNGQQPGVVMWYVAWSANSAFPTADAQKVAQTGATPEITWEPWNPSNGTRQPTYSLRSITSGKYDTYIKNWAAQIKSYGLPVRLRFAHEMNGNWYPWDEGVNGNSPGSYAAAWKHVRSLFTGLTNVTWVWSPNVPYTGSTALTGLYPGDSYVDEVALDGYNWSNLQAGSTWTSFHDVFAPGLQQLQSLTQKPITIGEVGCPADARKPQWISDMWAALQTWTQVRGLVWFDYNKEADWRIDSDPQSTSAYSAGIGPFVSS